MVKIIINTIILGWFLIIPWIMYVYATTTWNDCMQVYIEEYYPEWAVYYLNWYWYHIDKRDMENEYLIHLYDVEWCNVGLANIVYCYFTLTVSKIKN